MSTPQSPLPPYGHTPAAPEPTTGTPYGNTAPPTGNPYGNTPPPTNTPYGNTAPPTGNPYGNTPPPTGNPYSAGAPAPGGNPYAGGAPGAGPAHPAYQAFPPAQPQTHPYPQPQPGVLTCQFCGGAPALRATVRGHQGFLVIMRFLKVKGQFCHDCGIALHREMSAKTLWQGWWGIASFIITPITLAINAVTRVRLSRLARPSGNRAAPQPVGKPVIRRAGALGALVPVAALAVLVTGIALDDSAGTARAGDCVQVTGTGPSADVKVVDCASAEARYRVSERHSGSLTASCPQDATSAYTETTGDDSFTLCLRALR